MFEQFPDYPVILKGVNDVRGLAKAVVELIKKEISKDELNISALNEIFSPQAAAERYEDIIKDLLNEKKSSKDSISSFSL